MNIISYTFTENYFFSYFVLGEGGKTSKGAGINEYRAKYLKMRVIDKETERAAKALYTYLSPWTLLEAQSYCLGQNNCCKSASKKILFFFVSLFLFVSFLLNHNFSRKFFYRTLKCLLNKIQ